MKGQKWFFNQDAQRILYDTKELDKYLDTLKDVGPGSGEMIIHLYALKRLLSEIRACRH